MVLLADVISEIGVFQGFWRERESWIYNVLFKSQFDLYEIDRDVGGR